jgi:ABC-type glycerol-3-phosphate transport system substrate-binding protein
MSVMRRVLFILLSNVTAVLLIGCSLFPSADNNEPPPVSTLPPPAVATVGAQTPPPIALPPTLTPTNRSLVIWLPPAIASRTETGAITLSDQIVAFNSTHPDLEIVIEQKPTNGQGGALNYLRTGRAVASTVLPDLIVLPVTQLAASASEGLIFPLEDFLDPAVVTELFPPAQQWAFNGAHLVGLPFALTNVQHLEYSRIITDTPPLTWGSFITTPNRHMVLPAAGPMGGQLVLQFYLANGGTLTNEAGQPALDVDILTAALEQLLNGRANGFILQQSSNLTDLADSVRLVRDGTIEYSLTSSDVYLQNESDEYIPSIAPLPGWDGALPSVVEGWAWAISTPDPDKMALAAQLIATLTTPENLGAWSRQSRILPAYPAALAAWPATDPYPAFIRGELERAIPATLSPTSRIPQALENAAFDVISLSRSPRQAAEEAAAALQP